MNLHLKEVLETERTILKNLFSLYLHDLSSFTSNIDIGEDGSFEYDGIDEFWETEGLSPYFIISEKDIIGFILLVERPFLKKDYDFGVNDLFVLNKYKGNGFGRQAIVELFKVKKGKYFVIELVENSPAVSFWKKIYCEMNIQFEERQDVVDDDHCFIQTFIIG
ncbi:GNAT family N-acetyltransferase [Psychrobacillus antarcticus]|uniref:GNAT family N-acetyltransferase n=1 Tax=Psychrobacillus antarcticus TaxID=2879115 RepID=UPI002407D447|nr:GNAT family N-acetyltransferase [Psychrobacillus antarcticus]